MLMQDRNLLDVETFRFPFLGSSEDGEVFEYIVMELGIYYALILIPNWLVNRVSLSTTDSVQLYLPSSLIENYQTNGDLKGKVLLEQNSNKEKAIDNKSLAEEIRQPGMLYRINFKTPLVEPKEKNAGEEEKEPLTSLIALIKDSMLLKNGILIYVKHIIPFFSRITNYSELDYKQLKEAFLTDVLNRVQANLEYIEALFHEVSGKSFTIEEIAMHIDLEKFRESIQSEINFTIFKLAFEPEQNLPASALFQGMSPSLVDKYSYFVYIDALKTLEKRLYSNFNQIVMIYAKSLKV